MLPQSVRTMLRDFTTHEMKLLLCSDATFRHHDAFGYSSGTKWLGSEFVRRQIVRSPQLAQAVGQLDHVLQSGQVLPRKISTCGSALPRGVFRTLPHCRLPLDGAVRVLRREFKTCIGCGGGRTCEIVSWGLQGRQVVQSFGLPPEAAGGPGFDAVGPGKGKVRVNGWERAELWRRGWAC